MTLLQFLISSWDQKIYKFAANTENRHRYRKVVMASEQCSFCNDPAHVRPGQSRREFLYVGLVGGLGLTLGNFMGARQARAGHKTCVRRGARANPHTHLPPRRKLAPRESSSPTSCTRRASRGVSSSVD